MKQHHNLQSDFSLPPSFTHIAKRFLLLFALTAFFFNSKAQNTNYRAQGNYYSAKTNLKNGKYAEAISYVKKSKEMLGGTNEELQYLHILAAYRLDLVEEAKKELETFFDISDKKVKAIDFDKSVDRLTNDETKELTMLMDPIFEAVDRKLNHRCKKCTGTGTASIIKTTYEHCNKCGETDKGYYTIDGDNGMGGIKRSGYKWTEWKGYTRSTCEKCNGKGLEVCSKCNGFGTNCKGCNRHPVNPSGYKGFSFYCSPCSGSGYSFKQCDKCSGTKSYAKKTTENIVCPDCRGKGY